MAHAEEEGEDGHGYGTLAHITHWPEETCMDGSRMSHNVESWECPIRCYSYETNTDRSAIARECHSESRAE